MRNNHLGIWQALIPLWFLLVCMFAQAGCSCEPTGQAQSNKTRPCIPQHARRAVASPLKSKTIVPGTIPASFTVTDSGDAALSMSLEVPPGRAGIEPSLAISYSSASGDGVLAMGFSISGASAITRCPKTMAIDGQIRSVQYDASDAICLDTRRLVLVAENETSREFRTIPDTQVKVVEHLATKDESYFEAFLPDGSRVLYGASESTRPTANTGVPRAWLAEEQRDTRGNAMLFDYCLAEDDEGTTVEYALTSIRYSAFEDEEPQRAVVFAYDVRKDAEIKYAQGMKLQESLQLAEIQLQGPDDELVRRYEFAYVPSEPTGRSLLESVQACASNGECFEPTRFQYAEPETGFDDITTDIDAPLSDKASPMFFDVDRDGLSDYVVGDTTAFSTPEHPITEWRIAKNAGGAFAAEKVALLQEWSLAQNPEPIADLTQIQPEVGTAIDFTGGGTTGIFLHDVTGSQANHVVLLPQNDETLQAADTQIRRPFPLVSSPAGLRNSNASVHLVDVTGAMADLIECNDHGDTPETAALPTWKLHVWQPGGFSKVGVVIDVLTGYPCQTPVYPVDLDRNGITDLIVPGMIRVNGVPSQPAPTYSVMSRNTDGTWVANDTKLAIPPNAVRVLFVDVNRDGLPDAITSGDPTGQLVTWMNTGKGFGDTPTKSLQWDVLTRQDKYFHLAIPGDFNGDGRADLLLAMLDPDHPTIPRWVILEANADQHEFTFHAVVPEIPFEAILDDNVTLADPRLPRVVDWNGDGASDIALFLGGRLHIFQNRAADPDVLIGFFDGTNDHDVDDPAFVPNASISYGHLADGNDLYIARDDPANDCVYPRHCAVGAKRVVSEYATNDGQGGQRRYGLRYRDGRYDRETQQWLGFGKRLLTDLDTGETTVDFYDNVTKVKVGDRDVYPFVGQVVKQWQWSPGLPTQPNPAQIEMTFAKKTLEVAPTNDGASYFTLATKTHTRRLQGSFAGGGTMEAYVGLVESLENATMLRESTVEVLDFDEFANVLEVDVKTESVDATMHVTRTVKNDVNKWQIGLPDTQTECSGGGGTTLCRTITRTTNTFGEVETEATSSSDGIKDTQLSVRYKRDKYGHITKVVADDAFGQHREQTTIYDDNGEFPEKLVNALGHVTRVQYDPMLGVLKTDTEPNGLVTSWEHDGFGRITKETRPDGSSTTVARTREQIDGVWRLRERTTITGRSDDETVFDSLGRVIAIYSFASQPTGKPAKRIVQFIEYDRLSGEVARKSVPAVEGTPAAQLQWDVYEYDALGREVRHTTPWNAVTTTVYSGNSIVVSEPQLVKTSTLLDTLGRVVKRMDAAANATTYAYGPFNTLRSVTAPGNTTTTWTRDAFGRVRKLEEPDRGTTDFVNDVFGDVVSSTDALGRTVTWTRDTLGRVETRTDTHAGKTLTTKWTWDTAPNGIGELHTLMSPDALQTFSYTKQGQVDTVTLTVGNDSFVVGATYDPFGRTRSIRYPQPLGVEPFEVLHARDPHGHVIAVRDASSGDAYWELIDTDEAGRYAKETLDNSAITTTRMYDHAKQSLKSITTKLGGSTIQQLSYDWTDRLNLKSRTDTLQSQNKTERFKYDALDRLTCAYFSPVESPNAACASSYGYAANGNLTSKSDIGALTYADAKHPHAVTGAAGGAYWHDAVGNQITRPGSVAITYTPFDLPKTITKNGQTTTFGYDGDQQRVRKTSGSNETIYVDDLFEQVTSGNAKEFRYYVHSPERAIAIVTRASNGTETKRWLHVDHLGSVETVTNENGAVAEKRSYDAFGGRRNPQWGLPGSGALGGVKPGFTGHEEEDEFGLINMKGRLFDPRIGRFTTTDPVITDLLNAQTLNPYGYVRNNPLTLVDPSGFNEEEARRLWRVEETGELGIRITFDKMPEPTPRPLPPANVGAEAPTHDTSTTGQTPTSATRAPSAGEQLLEGMGDRAIELLPQLAWGIIDANMGGGASTLVQAKPGDLQWEGAGGRMVDKLNEGNPLYAAGVDMVDGANAYEKGDFVGVGRSVLGFGVTALMTAITLKGAKTTRGPPKAESVHDHHVMTNKNYVSGARGGPWSPIFAKMAAKAGMKLSDVDNRVRIPGHQGPHPEAYHKTVFKRLQERTDGLSGDAYTRAFREELGIIRQESATPGTALHRLLVK